MTDDLIPMVLFLVTGGAFVARSYFRYKANQEQQVTVRELMARGQDVSPEVLETLLQGLLPAPQADLRRGVMGLMIGLALVVFAFVLGEPDARQPLMGIAAFPALIGVAYLALWRFNQRED